MKVAGLPVFQNLNCHRLRVVFAGCLFCGLFWAGGSGFCDARIPDSINRGAAELIPVAPQNHVLDEANMFPRHPEILEEMQASLSRMEQKHDFPVYLATYYNAYDMTLQELADKLYAAWVGESGQGMVIVYQLDPVISGYNPAIAYNKGIGFNPDFPSASESIVMPGRDVDALLKKVFVSINGRSGGHIALISSLIHGIEREIDHYHKLEPTSWNDTENLKLMAVFLGVVVSLGLMGVFAWKLLYPANARSRRVYYFPEVTVEPRLGAPYGGSQVSEKSFDPSSFRG